MRSIAKDKDILEAERRQLTVMFCDLVDSTVLSDRLDPEDLNDVLRAYREACGAAVEQYDGQVAGYSGDGILAYFGYPTPHEDDPERSVLSALALIRLVESFDFAHPVAVRIGLHTGLVIAGEKGPNGENAEIVGKATNIAARLQSLCDPNSVVVSESTRHLADGCFEWRSLGKHYLKGIADPVDVYSPIRATDIKSRFEQRNTLHLTPMIGRVREIDKLKQYWSLAKRQLGQVVLLKGEAGIGKSRTILEFRNRIERQPHTSIQIQCSPFHTNSTLFPIVDTIERLLNFQSAENDEERLLRIESAFARSTTANSNATALIASMLSVQSGKGDPGAELSLQQRKSIVIETLTEHIIGLSLRSPVLLVVEDIHWSDPSTKEALQRLAQRIGEHSVLLLISSRPDTELGDFEMQARQVVLKKLLREQSAHMISSITGSRVLFDTQIDEIIERTDGIPLFVEEFTKATVEQYATSHANESRVGTHEHPSLSIPETLQDSLNTRLGKHSPARMTAQIGAAIGREFAYELLAEISTLTNVELDSQLERLVSSGIIYLNDKSSTSVYCFTHSLVRDAAYESMLRRRRIELHGTIANLLEKQFSYLVANRYELLAQHFSRAQERVKAVEYWIKAGSDSYTRSAIAEAIAHLKCGQRDIAALPDIKERLHLELELLMVLGRCCVAAKGYTSPDTIDSYVRAQTICKKLGNPPQHVTVLHNQWLTALMTNNLLPARQLASEMLQKGAHQNDHMLTVMGHQSAGVTCFAMGEFQEGYALLHSGLRLLEPARRAEYFTLLAGDPNVIMPMYLAWISIHMGKFDEGISLSQQALEQAHHTSHVYMIAHALNAKAFTEILIGNFDAGLTAVNQLEDIVVRHDIAFYRAYIPFFRGLVDAETAGSSGTTEAISNALNAYKSTGTHLYTNFFHCWLGFARCRDGKPEKALLELEEAERIAQTGRALGAEGEILRVRGEIYQSAGKPVQAEQCYQNAITCGRNRGAKLWELRSALCLARLLIEQGRYCEAQAITATSVGSLAEGHDTFYMRSAQTLLDELTETV